MTTLLLTIAIAFIIIILAVASLAIGWLITGKMKIRSGACGQDPNKKRDEASCGTGSCNLCERDDPKGRK